MKNIAKIPTAYMNREEWLEQRKKSIGGSDAAAIIGLSKWASPYSVWADKTGRVLPSEDNEAMRQGRDLEDYVARRWMEATGKRVRRENAMLYHPDYPFAHADIDRWVIGENAGLECKTTSTLDMKQFKGVEFPEKYYAQCVHYMAVTGADRWYLAVLLFGRDFFVFTLERDQAEIDALMEAERGFWKFVETDMAPSCSGLDVDDDTLLSIYSGGQTEAVDLFGFDSTFGALDAIKKQIKELECEQKRLEQLIKAELGDHETGAAGKWKTTWKSSSRSIFDVKAFALAYPEMELKPWYKESVSRRFTIKEEK